MHGTSEPGAIDGPALVSTPAPRASETVSTIAIFAVVVPVPAITTASS